MTNRTNQRPGGRRHWLRRLVATGTVLAASMLVLASVAFGAQATVGLGTANTFAVLAGSTVTNTGPSVIGGDVGLAPGSAVTGFPPGIVNAGTIHVNDGMAMSAKSDLTTAYNDAAGRSSTATISSDLAGRTLVSGVYTSATSLGLSGNLTLDAQGDPNAVFIFQAGTTLTTGAGAVVTLIGGAQACNVFWQVGSSATIGTGSRFIGVIMALDSISMTTGATLQGSALARNGAVTLDTNTITRAGCATPVGGSTTGTGSGTGTGAGTGTGGGTATGTGTTGTTGNGTPAAHHKHKHKTTPKTRPAHGNSKPKAGQPAPKTRAKSKPVKPAQTPPKPKPATNKPPAFTG